MNQARGLLCAAPLLIGCKQSLDLGRNIAGLSLDATAITVPMDGTQVALTVTLSGDAQAAGTEPAFDDCLPHPGIHTTFSHNPGDSKATIFFSTDPDPTLVRPGTTQVRVKWNNPTTGVLTTAQPLTLTIAVVAKVTPTASGALREFVSTSLQPAPFQQYIPDPGALADLTQNPIHVQVFDPPWQGTSIDDATWHFEELDGVLAPLLARDAGVQLQIYTVPTFIMTPSFQPDWFERYCLGLLSYYNRTDAGAPVGADGGVLRSRFPGKVGFWSLLGDCNGPSVYCPSVNYAQIYNRVARAMRAADGTIKLSAPEASDGLQMVSLDPNTYLAGLLGDGGLDPSLVDSVAVHMFAFASNTPPPDDIVFGSVPTFAAHMRSIVSQLRNAGMANVDVWVTQSNISANAEVGKFPDGGPIGNDGHPLVIDTRGTSAVFVAWQAYMFSQLGQAGNAGLFHWEYTAGHDPDGGYSLDTQNAEVGYDDDGGIKYPSYWVDLWLGQMFPTTRGHQVLQLSAADSTKSVDVLATKEDDGSVLVMVTDIAVDSNGDAGATSSCASPNLAVSGRGQPRTVIVDLSAFAGPDGRLPQGLSSASLLTIDQSARAGMMPTPVPIQGGRVTVVLGGYGVAFLHFKSAP